MKSFKLGTDAGDHVTVEVHERTYEGDDWLAATISIRSGAFAGSFDAALMTCDFQPFERQLQELYESLRGTATFSTIERQLEVNCVGNERGGISIDGVAQDRAGDGNQLRFQFDLDQTYLPELISELQQIQSEFPNKLHPEFPQ